MAASVIAGLQNHWKGRTHMHTAFWLVWFVPIATMAYLDVEISALADFVLLPYLIFATVGAWRSTDSPPGALWPASLYRLALFIFGLLIICGVMIIAYTAITT